MAKERQIIEIPEFPTVRELATLMGASPIEVMKRLISNGVMATINQQLEYDTAAIVAEEMGFEPRPVVEIVEEVEEDVTTAQRRRMYADEDPKNLVRRPPVVTILGHVDHGKTSLLDIIREAHVADGESGGITQHIGAYQVNRDGRKITFLDTPGHEAFTAMRARGAQGADIVVLVVAADDGVMTTTKEAVAHARAAHVPIVVAVTKTDKRNANVEKVKQELSDLELTPDDWGGTTMVIPTSARDKSGIDDLLEAILMTADENQIVANPKSKAAGTVIESRLEKARGFLVTLLVQNGTLKLGDALVAGTSVGRIRAMFDENGKSIKEAGPSVPVVVMGLNDLPSAGDQFLTAKNEREARELVEERKQESANADKGESRALTLEELFKRAEDGEIKELRIILKVDVQGSLQPLVESLEKLKTDAIGLRILYAEAGNITENDVNLAISSTAIVIGFHVDVDNAAHRLAEASKVEIRQYTVLYQMTEDIEKALKGLLEPVYEERVLGTAEVRKVFRITKVGKIAGCYVREGEIRRNGKVRVRRDREIIAQNLGVAALKRESEDVREVRSGFECGVNLDNFDDYRPGDLLEFTVRERVS